MSRIAEVLRKSYAFDSARGTLGIGPSGPDADRWAAVPIPWDIERRDGGAAATAPPTSAGGDPAMREQAAPLSLPVASDELTLLLRLFHPSADGSRVRSVLFSAIGDERGSAEVSAATARALAARQTGSVCLVDANLRSPVLPAVLGSTSSHGLSEALLEPANTAPFLTCVADRLWLLPAGSARAEALPHLTVERVQPCVASLLTTFDHVIVNAPAVNQHRDAALLAPLTDGVVLVVSANATRREAARRAAAQLRALNITVLGAILTNRTFPIPDLIYRIL